MYALSVFVVTSTEVLLELLLSALKQEKKKKTLKFPGGRAKTIEIEIVYIEPKFSVGPPEKNIFPSSDMRFPIVFQYFENFVGQRKVKLVIHTVTDQNNFM